MTPPYINQLDNAPRGNDCGCAVCVMLAGEDRPEIVTPQTVTALSRRFDANETGTTPDDVVAMLKWLGVDAEIVRDTRYPCISLVDYRSLPVRSQPHIQKLNPRTGKWYWFDDFAHWILRMSDTEYHDPLWHGDLGANRTATKAELDAAELAARRWITSKPVPIRIAKKQNMATPPQTKGKAKVKRGPWKVRSAPNQFDTSVTGSTLATGAEIDVLSIVPGGAYTYGVVSKSVGGAPTYNATATAPFVEYVRADGFERVGQTKPPPDVVIPPAPTRERFAHAKYQLGVNVLQFADYGFRALRDGCRFVLFMDNGGAAVTAARDYPDAIIMYRRYHNSKLDPQSMFNLLDIDWKTAPANLYITLSNENDTQNPNNLPEYLEWFQKVCALIWAINPNVKICFGSWGHGNPNWTDSGVANTWRTLVAPWLNQNAHRVVCDLHTYTKGKRRESHPPTDAKVIGTDWFETRHKFAYDNGLSHAVRHLSGEAGVEAGHGGFPWAGYTEQQFREWAHDVVNAQRIKTPMLLGGALYHYGEHAGWGGYHITPYYGVLTQLWRDDVPYEAAR
jgi:hypothetical protein